MSTAFINRALLVLCVVGMFIAGALSLAHLLQISIPCGFGSGCSDVANSPKSFVLGFPIAYAGFIGYTLLALLTYVRMTFRSTLKPAFYLGYVGSLVGMLGSFYLTYFSISEIGALCSWCLASVLVITLIFVCHAILISKPELEAPETGRKDSIVLIALLVGLPLALGMHVVALKIRASKVVVDTAILQGSSLEDLAPADAHILGDPKAPITLVEFADLLCPMCRQTFSEIKQLVKDHPGKIRVVFRHRPMTGIPGHEMAAPAALLSELADTKGRFWEFIEAVYAHPEPLFDEESLLAFAKEFGISPEEARKAIKDDQGPLAQRLDRDLKFADKIGIMETPVLFLLAPGQEMQVLSAPALAETLELPQYQQFLKK